VRDYKCGNCRFFCQKIDDEGAGICRRYPPVVIAAVSSERTGSDSSYDGLAEVYSNASSEFPLVDSNDWCGEHSIKMEILDRVCRNYENE
jgi:hypothetical protein